MSAIFPAQTASPNWSTFRDCAWTSVWHDIEVTINQSINQSTVLSYTVSASSLFLSIWPDIWGMWSNQAISEFAWRRVFYIRNDGRPVDWKSAYWITMGDANGTTGNDGPEKNRLLAGQRDLVPVIVRDRSNRPPTASEEVPAVIVRTDCEKLTLAPEGAHQKGEATAPDGGFGWVKYLHWHFLAIFSRFNFPVI